MIHPFVIVYVGCLIAGALVGHVFIGGLLGLDVGMFLWIFETLISQTKSSTHQRRKK